jgi:transcriptional regulator
MPKKRMTNHEVEVHVLRARRLQQQKISRFWLSFNAGVPPMSAAAENLLLDASSNQIQLYAEVA